MSSPVINSLYSLFKISILLSILFIFSFKFSNIIFNSSILFSNVLIFSNLYCSLFLEPIYLSSYSVFVIPFIIPILKFLS